MAPSLSHGAQKKFDEGGGAFRFGLARLAVQRLRCDQAIRLIGPNGGGGSEAAALAWDSRVRFTPKSCRAYRSSSRQLRANSVADAADDA